MVGDEFKFLQILDNTPYVGIEINNTSSDIIFYGLPHLWKRDPTQIPQQYASSEMSECSQEFEGPSHNWRLLPFSFLLCSLVLYLLKMAQPCYPYEDMDSKNPSIDLLD